MTFDQFRDSLDTIDVGGTTLFVVEWDLCLDAAQLHEWWVIRHPPAGQPVAGRRLIGKTKGGRLVRWAPGVDITWAMGDFAADPTIGARVMEGMLDAQTGWNDLCGVNIREAKPGEPPMFMVRLDPKLVTHVAFAFFPDDPTERRQIRIAPTFPNGLPESGVLRHEMGHVLGFHHELARGQDLVQIGSPDPPSVMNPAGPSALFEFTDRDRDAAERVYGWPLDKSELKRP